MKPEKDVMESQYSYHLQQNLLIKKQN